MKKNFTPSSIITEITPSHQPDQPDDAPDVSRLSEMSEMSEMSEISDLAEISLMVAPTIMNSSPSGRRRAPAPRRQTIMFLRQFARAYTLAPQLPRPLAPIVAN